MIYADCVFLDMTYVTVWHLYTSITKSTKLLSIHQMKQSNCHTYQHIKTNNLNFRAVSKDSFYQSSLPQMIAVNKSLAGFQWCVDFCKARALQKSLGSDPRALHSNFFLLCIVWVKRQSASLLLLCCGDTRSQKMKKKNNNSCNTFFLWIE